MVSSCGKEAIVGIVGPGGILGAGCIFDEDTRTSTAVALERVTLVRIERQDLKYVLCHSTEFNQEFLRCVLRQKREVEESLADQLFSSSERRLARILMMLSQNPQGIPGGPIPRLSQTTLAAMVGTTRSRISYFLGRFRQSGLIEGGAKIRVNAAQMGALLGK
jgi:CRP-like cAMP-binding protein